MIKKTKKSLVKPSKTYRVIVNDNIVSLIFSKNLKEKEQNIEMSARASAEVLNFLKRNKNKKMSLLIDVGKLKDVIFAPRQSRINYASMSYPNLKKVAVVSENIYIKVIAKSIIFISGTKIDFGCFNNKKEALLWLKN